MAKPTREGLHYWNLDCNFDSDDKILWAKELIDPDGSNPMLRFIVPMVYILINDEIYQNSYYLEWDDSKCLRFINKHGNGCLSYNMVQRYIEVFLKVSLYDQDLFEQYGILTSGSIQERWEKIKKSVKSPQRVAEPFRIDRKPPGLSAKPPRLSAKPPRLSAKPPITSEVMPSNGDLNPANGDLNPQIIFQQQQQGYSNEFNSNTHVVVEKSHTSEEIKKTSEVARDNLRGNSDNAGGYGDNLGKPPVQPPVTSRNYQVTPSLNAILPLNECLQHFFFNPNMERQKYTVCNMMGWLDDSGGQLKLNEDLALEWAYAYNRWAVMSGDTKSVMDWGKHFMVWLQKQDHNKDPKQINSKSVSADRKRMISGDGMSIEELKNLYKRKKN